MNKFGQSLINLCCTYSVHILNDGKSIVYYVIVLSDLFENVKCFYVDNIEFLDHFPIVCHLKFENIANSNNIADEDCKSTDGFEQYK